MSQVKSEGNFQPLTPMAIPSTQTPPPLPKTLQHYGKLLQCMQLYCTCSMPANAGDLTACQLPHPSSSLPQGVVGSGAHSSHKPLEDALQKRELRLMKNREAARECRRKKKEYVKCLENRVAVLENQNKTLIEELRALKDIYRHKAE
ncbi:cAMP-responsive element modulator-like isoform X2 [Sparus aurata]|uniref:cAMP-responsive element modulator-like isoform X2 n=1 Tax=Sparus aurata TaxID=8175 RepID=UPI0011C0E68E|nr:cAMP-responsive element modulator-like isoform X2 [Sparus aurata]